MNDQQQELCMVALASVLAKPPPSPHDLLNIFNTMILINPPPDPLVDIRRRLFPSIDNSWQGRDLLRIFVGHPFEFYMVSSESLDTCFTYAMIFTTNITPVKLTN